MYEYQSSNNGGTDGYLNNGLWWWTLTPYSTSYVRYVNGNGNVYNSIPSSTYGVRPSINLKSSVRIVDGDGTIDNPYRLNGDNDTNLSGTVLSSRYSGEYIKFGNDENNLYRIVSHENGTGTKITSAEPLKEDGELKGQSAYEVAVKNGYIGTEEEWLNSLIGKQGPTGISVVKVEKTKTEGLIDTYTITYSDESTSTFQITNGKTPVKGTDYFDDNDKQEIVDDVVTATTPSFEQKHTIYRKEVTEAIEAESEIVLDFSYKSGNLEVFYCGERLLKDEDYEEVFDEGLETSNKIKVLFDVPLSEEFPRYFDFVVKGVIEDA